MDAGEVTKNVVEQTNNVTTGNETNSELETVPPNRFTLLFKIPCIYDKCSSDMYIVFWIGNIMLLMGIFGNVYTLVKIVRSKLYRSTIYACIIMLVTTNMAGCLSCASFQVFCFYKRSPLSQTEPTGSNCSFIWGKHDVYSCLLVRHEYGIFCLRAILLNQISSSIFCPTHVQENCQTFCGYFVDRHSVMVNTSNRCTFPVPEID